MIHPQPKGPKRKTVKRKKAKAESAVKVSVREQCVERDGHCRYARDGRLFMFGHCDGRSEWAHLGAKKRARTRGQAPELRHTTAGSLMLCRRHHALYDAGRMVIDGNADEGLGFSVGIPK